MHYYAYACYNILKIRVSGDFAGVKLKKFMDKKGKNKKLKTIIYVSVAVVVIAIATTATIMIINSNNNTTNSSVKTKKPVSNKSAETLMAEAEAARKDGDTAERKALLSEAAAKLKLEPKTDTNTNAQVDVAAQQCMAGVKSACKGY